MTSNLCTIEDIGTWGSDLYEFTRGAFSEWSRFFPIACGDFECEILKRNVIQLVNRRWHQLATSMERAIAELDERLRPKRHGTGKSTCFLTLPAEMRQAILLETYDYSDTALPPEAEPDDFIVEARMVVIQNWASTLRSVHPAIIGDVDFVESKWDNIHLGWLANEYEPNVTAEGHDQDATPEDSSAENENAHCKYLDLLPVMAVD